MRIRTDGKFAYREALVDDDAEQLGENTRVGAVEASCEFSQAMLPLRDPSFKPRVARLADHWIESGVTHYLFVLVKPIDLTDLGVDQQC